MAAEWNRATFTIDNILHTQTNIINAFESFLTQTGWVRASWSGSGTDRYYLRTDRNTQPRWQFTGDGVTKNGGIRVFYDATPQTTTGLAAFAGQKHIVIQSFLENAAATALQVQTQDVISTTVASGVGTTFRLGTIRIVYDNTAPNNYLVIGGEDGLYVEVGRDSLANNLGHGMIMTFGAIPENHSPLDNTVNWTAQGLVADFLGVCRFSHDCNSRSVSNDGTNKNFTACLQPQSPRGTSSIITQQIVDQRAYYIGSRDLVLGMGHGALNDTTTQVTSDNGLGNVNLKYHCSFGLFNTPEAGRYRISPIVMIQSMLQIATGVTSTTTSDVAANTSVSAVVDSRTIRQIFRLAAADYTLLPFVNIQDAVSGAIYRVAQIADNGRPSNIGIIWPSSAFLSISL